MLSVFSILTGGMIALLAAYCWGYLHIHNTATMNPQITTTMQMERSKILFKTTFPTQLIAQGDTQARDLCAVHRETPQEKKMFIALLVVREIFAQVWRIVWYYWLFRLLRYGVVDFWMGVSEVVRFVQPWVSIASAFVK